MATRNQLNPPPKRKITDFKSKLSGGGARSNLFEVVLSFPDAAPADAGITACCSAAAAMSARRSVIRLPASRHLGSFSIALPAQHVRDMRMCALCLLLTGLHASYCADSSS